MFKEVTLNEVLLTKAFEGSKVIAGHSGLNKTVKTVTVAEVPDAMDWLKGGELVVTTAYYLKNDEQLQKKWVQGLIQNNAVALAIKPLRFIGMIPDTIIDIGNRYDFPIIELPFAVTWPQIIESVSNLILDRQAATLRHSEEIHNTLTRLVIESKGLQSIAETIGRLVRKPIIIEDQWLNNLAIASDYEEYKEIIKQRTSPEYFSKLQKLIKTQRPANNYYLFKNSIPEINQYIYPIVIENKTYGYLTALVTAEETMGKRDLIALEHGVTVIALELVKQKAMFESQERFRLNMLTMLLEQPESSEDFRKQASVIGFDVNGPLLAIIVKWESNSNRKHDDEIIAQSLSRRLYAMDEGSLVISRNVDVVAFIHLKSRSVLKIKELLTTLLFSIEQEFKGLKIIAGMGNSYNYLAEYKKSYDEAAFAINCAFLHNKGPVIMYSDLGHYRLFSLIKNRKELEKYCKDVLGELLDSNQRDKVDLLDTLEKFLVANGNRAEVARRLYVHINTVNYRMKKIENLLNVNLNEMEVRLNLFLAITAFRSICSDNTK